MICRHKLYHFTVANTRFTAPLTLRGKNKFATVKWYNFCRQIIQSQPCYFLIYNFFISSPEPKARVSYCHSAPSVVRPSVRKLFIFSTSPEPLDGFWWNLVGMKYSWSLTNVVVFQPDPPGADPGWGQNRSRGSPSSKKLLLQTGRLQRQTECIAMI